jgi:hypothetical protein
MTANEERRSMTSVKPPEIAMSDIHENPLLNYPHVIVTLMRQRAIKIVKAELVAKGVQIWDVTSAQILLLAQAYVAEHREEMIRVACDTVRIADGLRQVAEQEARRRAKARRDRDVIDVSKH